MKLKLGLLAIGLGIAAALMGASAYAQEPPPPDPSAGTVLASGELLQPRGLAVGPDGMVYVAEAGTGGDTEFTVGEGEESFTVMTGFTGRISKVDPDTGERTTVADGLFSRASSDGEALGAADVAFIGTTLYVLMTLGGEANGFPDDPTGIYRITAGGDAVLVADIGAFNEANPTEAITDGSQPDVDVGGNPYAMIERNGVFYVSDGNHNRLMRVTVGGDVSEVTEFPEHPVSTGIASTPNGPFYVAYLGQGPFLPEGGAVVSVDPTSGAITEVARGAAMLTDVERGPDGLLYALQFNDPEEAGEAFFAPGTGKVMTVNSDGTLSSLVTGLSFATAMVFEGDTLFVLDFGIGPGSVIKIENFSDVEPPPAPTAAPTSAPSTPVPGGPAATATPRGGVIGAPDTGSGGYADQDGSSYWLLLVLVGGAAVAATGGALALKRR